MRSERGAVLAQVLVLATLAALMCATVLKARLQPALTVARVEDHARDDLAAQGAINRVTEVWSREGVCGSDRAVGVECSGSGCGCFCTVAKSLRAGNEAYAAVVNSAASGGACVLSAVRQ